MHASNDVIMTAATNPEVLAICYAQGWCASADKMTKSEAEAVGSIGTAFQNTAIVHFDELKYFSAVTSIDTNAFRGCGALTTIILPPNCTSAGYLSLYAYKGALTYVEFPATIQTIGTQTLYYQTHVEIIVCRAMTAPSVGTDAFYSVGADITTTKQLIVPSGASGYESGDWLALQTTNGFTLQYI